jgi:hypothetical protein
VAGLPRHVATGVDLEGAAAGARTLFLVYSAPLLGVQHVEAAEGTLMSRRTGSGYPFVQTDG